MTKKQRAATIMKELEKIYPEVPIPLDHSDPFTLLVAVALSAQTTDKKVNQVTPQLFKIAGNPEKMAKLDVSEIKELIKEIGLSNQKAKNLKKMAELLLERNLTVSEVAYRVGIDDPFYFSKCFKTQFGVSPSAYMKGKADDKPQNT